MEAPVATVESPGIPEETVANTMVLPFNHPAALDRIAAHAHELAAVIVEPVQGSAGSIPGTPEFLAALRAVTARHGVVLIFDEVITGFRVALGGAQEHYGIRADLATFGKILGGRLSVRRGRGLARAHAAHVGARRQEGRTHAGRLRRHVQRQPDVGGGSERDAGLPAGAPRSLRRDERPGRPHSPGGAGPGGGAGHPAQRVRPRLPVRLPVRRRAGDERPGRRRRGSGPAPGPVPLPSERGGAHPSRVTASCRARTATPRSTRSCRVTTGRSGRSRRRPEVPDAADRPRRDGGSAARGAPRRLLRNT